VLSIPCKLAQSWNIISNSRERKCTDTLAQCRLPGMAISYAKIFIYFSYKIYGSDFIRQHSETVMDRNYQNIDFSLRKKFYCFHLLQFSATFVPCLAHDISVITLLNIRQFLDLLLLLSLAMMYTQSCQKLFHYTISVLPVPTWWKTYKNYIKCD